MNVTLEEITEDTLNDILELEVTNEQARFCPSVAVSIAQAHFSRYAWVRAVYADNSPVGFVMLYLDGLKPRYSISRLIIDKRSQNQGYGTAAMEQVIAFVRSLPEATELFLICPAAEGSPSAFFRKLGFTDTGETENGGRVMRLSLTD